MAQSDVQGFSQTAKNKTELDVLVQAGGYLNKDVGMENRNPGLCHFSDGQRTRQSEEGIQLANKEFVRTGNEKYRHKYLRRLETDSEKHD